MKQYLFYILSFVILLCSLFTVTSSKILRSAVYLLFVLIATSGIYFLMNYNFLAAVQLTLYAGGIIVLIIFSVMLTNSAGEKLPQVSLQKLFLGLSAAAIGSVISLLIFFEYDKFPERATEAENHVKIIGEQLINYGNYGYALPFEVISVLLLAAMVAAIIIAKRN